MENDIIKLQKEKMEDIEKKIEEINKSLSVFISYFNNHSPLCISEFEIREHIFQNIN